MSVVFFLPAFISPFMPNALSKFVLIIDVIFSYLYVPSNQATSIFFCAGTDHDHSWLTAFIFAAQDYNWHNCGVNSPPGLSCSKKKANEAFIFLTFIFTFFAIFLEVGALWAYRRESTPVREKNTGGAHGGPADAPVATA